MKKKKKTIAKGDTYGNQQMEQPKERSQRNQGLRYKPFLSSIADCVAGQESQFATKENILAMYSTFFRVMNPRNPTSKHVRSHMFKVKILLVFSVVSFADVCIKRSSNFDKMDEILLSIVNKDIIRNMN